MQVVRQSKFAPVITSKNSAPSPEPVVEEEYLDAELHFAFKHPSNFGAKTVQDLRGKSQRLPGRTDLIYQFDLFDENSIPKLDIIMGEVFESSLSVPVWVAFKQKQNALPAHFLSSKTINTGHLIVYEYDYSVLGTEKVTQKFFVWAHQRKIYLSSNAYLDPKYDSAVESYITTFRFTN